jgi:hypothetical protein
LAGKIIADIIEAPFDSIKMNVANVTVLTANNSGLTYLPTGNVNINIGSTASLTLGNVVATTANISGLITASGGIKFPATQVSSADVNTLDDYEEGTFTPVINFDGASVGVTYTTQVGTYTKVGRLITISCYVVLSNKGSSVGTPGISGLPFSSANITNNFTTSGSVWMFSASSLSGSLTMILPPNSSNLSLRAITGTGENFTISNSNFGNTTAIVVSASYFTA